MGNLWFKIKTWTKIVVMGLLLIAGLVFIVKNMNKEVKIWLWNDINTTVLMLIFFTLLIGVLGTLLIRAVFKTIRQIREMRVKTRALQMERDVADMKAKAAMLQTKSSGDKP